MAERREGCIRKVLAKQLTYATSLGEMLRERAQSAADRVILRWLSDNDDEQSLTYGELDARAHSIASHLLARAGSGERALLLHPPGLDYIAALFGCFYAGVVAVPAYPPRGKRPEPRLQSLSASCQARFVLSTRTIVDRSGPRRAADSALAQLEWIATDELEPARASLPDLPAEALALLQYTSGSTSEPKGVMLTHSHLFANLRALELWGKPTAEDRQVSWLPPYHDMGLIGGLLLPLSVGAELTLLSPGAFMQRPLRWLQTISSRRATISGGPNFAYELCARRLTPQVIEQLDLSPWRVAFCGAERVRGETLRSFAELLAPSGFRSSSFAPCYGLAEATLAVSLGPLGRPPITRHVASAALAEGRVESAAPHARSVELVGCGPAVDGCSILIVDPELARRKPDGEVGEIWVRSPSVAAGYWNAPALSEQTFQARLSGSPESPPYLRTGDLGYLSRGELFVTGRIKDLLILRGQNFYPEDIESTAEGAHPALRAEGAVAFSCERDGEEQLVLIHEIEPSQAAASLAIVEALRSVLAESLELSPFEVLLVRPGSVPRTSSGKRQRSRARQLYLAGSFEPLGSREPVPPLPAAASSALVAQVAAAMARLLGLETLEPDADFFWLGGHSLLATQLVSRLRDELRVELSLQTLFDAPTPRKLAAVVAQRPRLPVPAAIVQSDRSGALPLSFSQERMWFLHQLEPDGAAYNVAGAVLIEGPLEQGCLLEAFDQVLERHEALRTRFITIAGEPHLRIDERSSVRVVVHDLGVGEAADARASTLASLLASRPFDIACEPLARAELYRVGPERHVLAVSIHHLVSDAWSMGVLVRDLLELYGARLNHWPPPAPDGRLAYLDYARWQREQLSAGSLIRERDYWKQRLEGAEPLVLPTAQPRSAARSSAGQVQPFIIPRELMRALRALGASEGATLFMVLLAAFEVVLQRHSGQTDLVVGVPVAGRKHAASESLVGTFVNTLALRVQVQPALGFRELLRQVRMRAIEAYDHQDLPFEQLVAELGLTRRAGGSPLVQVMFDYQNVPMSFHAGALRLSPFTLSRGATQFDLSLLIHDTELGQTGAIEYSSELFDADAMQRFAEHYLTVLAAIVAQPECAVARLPLCDESERARILAHAGVARACPEMLDVRAQVSAFARSRPHAIAAQDRTGSLSYAELDQRVGTLARALTAAGARPGERVALYLERSSDLLVALLAVLETGAAYVPLDPRHPSARVAYVLEDAAPCLILTDEASAPALPRTQHRAQVLELEASVRTAPPSPSATPQPARAGDAAYVIYTSGSTGRPKGVEISRQALDNFLRSMADEPGLGPDGCVLSTTTLAFDIAALELLLPPLTGARVYVAEAEVVADGSRLNELIVQLAPTLLQATPASWRMLLAAGFQGSPALTVLCGGEALSPELAEQLRARCRALYNVYGPTETTIWSLLHRVDRAQPVVPIGRPIANTRAYVLDAVGELCPLGVAGELCIGGMGVARGYYHRTELTAERFVPDPFEARADARMYRTGDLARLRFDGTFEHLGRLDFQLKIRGFRIEPGEIEAALLEDPRVREALVIAREDQRDDVRLVAYYVAQAGQAAPAGELQTLLQKRLPDYMVPSAFVALAALPKTPNGKIDRAALPAPQAADRARDAVRLAPRDALEAALVELWREILHVDGLGVRDSFFALGGHSLLAVRMFARVASEQHVDVPLATLFESPTIEHLAQRIRAERGARASPAKPASPALRYLVPIVAEGEQSPLYCVHGAGGNVIGLSELARHVGRTRPFYGLQASGVDGLSAPFASIEAAARCYVEEIRQVQPHGPYHLSGYCGGGSIAFEMARQLRASGEPVALLALIDTYRPGVRVLLDRGAQLARNWSERGLLYVSGRVLKRLYSQLLGMFNALCIAGYRAARKPVPQELRDPWLTSVFFEAAARYRPQRYQGPMVVLRARDTDPRGPQVQRDLGWEGLAEGGLQVLDIPGDHDTLLVEPHATALAATLAACLERADARDSMRPRASV
ncbi:MAG: LgrB-like linear gramicidin synthetase subunit protein [Myxococcaceae bacterium]|nr:LgrB-like linear gramicidin synthetase subunit protein [Myxococcaceae bacterium]